MSELKITEEKVKEVASKSKTAKDILSTLFPDIFNEEYISSSSSNMKIYHDPNSAHDGHYTTKQGSLICFIDDGYLILVQSNRRRDEIRCDEEGRIKVIINKKVANDCVKDKGGKNVN